MKFLGIDLGWISGASGLCCLEGAGGHLRLLDLERRTEIAEILAWVDRWLPGDQPGMIAVDAPTLIANPTGMRSCDRQAHRYFGRHHAGCYPANLSRPFADRTVGFGQSLLARGFHHAPVIQPRQPGRYQIEVFPHAATVSLFRLERIIKYKKGTLAQRRSGLNQLRQLILTSFPSLEPRLANLELPEVPSTGPALKALEDRLDSLICAYVAAHWWYWGAEGNLVLGDAVATVTAGADSGYIIVPQPQTDEAP